MRLYESIPEHVPDFVRAILRLSVYSVFSASGYLVALLYGFVLTNLDNIQADLENPFDGISEDNINLDIIHDFNITLGKF